MSMASWWRSLLGLFRRKPKTLQHIDIKVGDWAAWKLRSSAWRRFGAGALMPAFHGDRATVMAAAEGQLSPTTVVLVFEVKAVLCGSLVWSKVDNTRWESNSPLYIYNPPDAAEIWYLMRPENSILGEFANVEDAMAQGSRVHLDSTLRNLGHDPRKGK